MNALDDDDDDDDNDDDDDDDDDLWPYLWLYHWSYLPSSFNFGCWDLSILVVG